MPITGIEPVTFALRERRSATEPNRHMDRILIKVLSLLMYFRINLFRCSSVSSFVKFKKKKEKEKSQRENYPLDDLLRRRHRLFRRRWCLYILN